MANPIAFAMIALGGLLVLAGLFLLTKRIKIAGIIITLFGLGAAAVPFLVSAYLATAKP